MTKKELIKEIAEIYSGLDDLIEGIGYVSDLGKRIQIKVNDLPDNTEEIEDDEKDED